MEEGLHRTNTAVTRDRSESGSSFRSLRLQSPGAVPDRQSEPPVSFSEQELLHSLEVDWARFRPGRRKHAGCLKSLPRQYFPLLYVAAHGAMFVAFLATNTLDITLRDLGVSGGAGMCLMLVTAVVFAYLVQSDPGYIRSKREHSLGDPGVQGIVVDDTPSAGRVPQTFCRACNTMQPLRAHHCAHCKRCVFTFDHHCWWLGRCIGGKNKPEFIAFLILQSVLTGHTAALLLASCFYAYFRAGVPHVAFLSLHSAGLLALTVTCLLVLQWVVRLSAFHIKLLLRNQTSVEVLRPSNCQYLKYFVDKPTGCCPGDGAGDSAPSSPSQGQKCSRRTAPRPFSLGVWRNLGVALFSRPSEWEPSMQPRPKPRHPRHARQQTRDTPLAEQEGQDELAPDVP